MAAALMAALALMLVSSDIRRSAIGQDLLPADGAIPSDPTGGTVVEDDAIEVLTRGAIHEAFAEVVPYEPQPGIIVDKQPPAPIDELVPEVRPEGDDYVWIRGYWAIDEELNDFYWVTGVFRRLPPNQQWVDGYWLAGQAEDGSDAWQWIGGFWTPVDTGELQYAERPPASLEMGPSSPAPGDDYFWVNGTWTYQTSGHSWRPGFWCAYRPGWVWVPARWTWTPGGYLYLDGFWDYPLDTRGHVYCPIYYRRPIYLARGYRYTPRYLLGSSRLLLHLWIRPGYCNYFFGDYYGDFYARRYYRSDVFHRRFYGYDPIFAYNNCRYRLAGVNYVHRLSGWHNYFDKHNDFRPRRTLADERRFVASHAGHRHLNQARLADDLREVTRRGDGDRSFVRLSDEQRTAANRDSLRSREVTEARRRVETEAAARFRDGDGVALRRGSSDFEGDFASRVRGRSDGDGASAAIGRTRGEGNADLGAQFRSRDNVEGDIGARVRARGEVENDLGATRQRRGQQSSGATDAIRNLASGQGDGDAPRARLRLPDNPRTTRSNSDVPPPADRAAARANQGNSSGAAALRRLDSAGQGITGGESRDGRNRSGSSNLGNEVRGRTGNADALNDLRNRANNSNAASELRNRSGSSNIGNGVRGRIGNSSGGANSAGGANSRGSSGGSGNTIQPRVLNRGSDNSGSSSGGRALQRGSSGGSSFESRSSRGSSSGSGALQRGSSGGSSFESRSSRGSSSSSGALQRGSSRGSSSGGSALQRSSSSGSAFGAGSSRGSSSRGSSSFGSSSRGSSSIGSGSSRGSSSRGSSSFGGGSSRGSSSFGSSSRGSSSRGSISGGSSRGSSRASSAGGSSRGGSSRSGRGR